MRLAPGGLRYVGVLLLAAGAVLFVAPVVAAVFVACAAGTLFFHRDPDRSPAGEGMVAPADGRVSVLREESDRVRLGIFMNVWDVHVNRAPVAGTVESVEHEPGTHRPAFSKESDRNERVRIDLETPHGPATITLIAGAFARRIHPYVSVGDRLERGERIGHISFGSRVDVTLPPAIDREAIAVERGDRVRAGETVVIPKQALVDQVGGD